jgi:hypothetical protein
LVLPARVSNLWNFLFSEQSGSAALATVAGRVHPREARQSTILK